MVISRIFGNWNDYNHMLPNIYKGELVWLVKFAGKDVVIGQNCKVVWHSERFAYVTLIVAAATLQSLGEAEKRLLEDLDRWYKRSYTDVQYKYH